MDCKTALHVVDVCRPSGDDLQDPELGRAVAHLEQCPACLARFRARQQFDARIAATVQAVAVPVGLRERIIVRAERRRIGPRYRPAMWASVATAAAAVFCVAAWLWFGRSGGKSAPVFAANEIRDLVTRGDIALAPTRDFPGDPKDSKQLADWCSRQLRELHLTATPPRDFPLAGPTAIARAGSLMPSAPAVAVFRYDDPARPGSHDVTVFAFPGSQFTIEGVDQSHRMLGQTRHPYVVAWVEGDTTYFAVFNGWLPKEWERLSPVSRPPAVT